MNKFILEVYVDDKWEAKVWDYRYDKVAEYAQILKDDGWRVRIVTEETAKTVRDDEGDRDG